MKSCFQFSSHEIYHISGYFPELLKKKPSFYINPKIMSYWSGNSHFLKNRKAIRNKNNIVSLFRFFYKHSEVKHFIAIYWYDSDFNFVT